VPAPWSCSCQTTRRAHQTFSTAFRGLFTEERVLACKAMTAARHACLLGQVRQTSANLVHELVCGRHHDALRAQHNCNAAGMRSVGERRFGREPRQDCCGAQWQPRARRCRCAAKSFPPSAPSPYCCSPNTAFPACGAAPKRSCMPFSPVFAHMCDYVTALPCAHARAPRAPKHTPMHTPPS
jgi:hypothetical protein